MTFPPRKIVDIKAIRALDDQPVSESFDLPSGESISLDEFRELPTPWVVARWDAGGEGRWVKDFTNEAQARLEYERWRP